MRARRTHTSLWLAAVLSLAIEACIARDVGGSGENDQGLGAGAGGSSVAGASGQAGGDPAGGRGSETGYHVRLAASRAVLCPGECAELSAEAVQGNAPYTYAWDNSLGAGAGPHTVCPTVTTTYAVTATDSGLEGEEFGRPGQDASAALEIVVEAGEACALDGGSPDDHPGAYACSIELPYEDPNGYPILTTLGDGKALATDADGNLYFAGTYTAAIDLGDGLNELVPTPSVFVAKYDARCRYLWSRRFNVDGHAVRFNTIAIGPSGEVVAAGWLLGTVAFDQHTVAVTGDGPTQGLLVAFDPDDGKTRWAQTPDLALDGGGGFYHLAFDGSGDMVLDGWGAQTITRDGVPLANHFTGALIAKLSSSREVEFARIFGGSESYARSAISDEGMIAVSSLSRENDVVYGAQDVLQKPGLWRRFVALLDANGALQWSRELDPELDEANSELGVSQVAFDAAGNVLYEHGDYVREDGTAVPEQIGWLDPDGTPQRSIEVSPPGYQRKPFSQGTFALDSAGYIVHTDQVDNTADLGFDAGIREEHKVPSDVVAQHFAPDGSLLWSRTFSTDVFELAWGLTTAPDDTFWVGHGKDTDGNPYSGTLRITKVAP